MTIDPVAHLSLFSTQPSKVRNSMANFVVWFNFDCVGDLMIFLVISTFDNRSVKYSSRCATDNVKYELFKQSWPRGYKTFSMLNSAEHEILNAHRYGNVKKTAFQAQISLECYFLCS